MTQTPLALITGGAQGIGLACAKALQADGAKIILADINADGVAKAAEELGNGAIGLVCDMADPDQISQMFDTIEDTYGPVEILVNNAGIANAKDFFDTTLDDFKKVIDINFL